MSRSLIKRGTVYLLCLVFLLSACNRQTDSARAKQFLYSGTSMGTGFNIKAVTVPESVNRAELKSRIDSLLDEINKIMSTYLDDSELSRFNSNASTDWQPISEPLYTVLKEAQRVHSLSHGAFDITVGPLVNLWGFGPDPMQMIAPSEAMIQERLQQSGANQLILKEPEFAAKKLRAGLYLDLSALAKGYAVDQIAELLERQGLHNYLVELGGELRLMGSKANGETWRIAVEKPNAEQRAVHKILPISDTGMATSGDYRNFFEVDGMRFSHTIDPRSGLPIKHKLASITVLRPSAMEADALATAMMVLGPEKGYQLAEQLNIAAFFIIKSTAGFEEKSSSAFAKRTGEL